MSSGRVVIDANLARSSMPGGGVVLLTAPSNISSVSTASTTSDAHSEEPHFNMRLIEAVQRSPCLYDANDRMYRSADYKIKVWNKLVQQLSFRGDARTLYNRWKQLRDKYGKEKKKYKNMDGQSQWQYYKYLQFLDQHMVDRTEQKFQKAQQQGDDYEYRPIVISDPTFGLNLVHQVRRHPCLFDIRDSKYRHTEYRNQAWAEIIKNLNFPGDINAIYKQWKKIRDRYVREKRKMRMSASGVSTEGRETEEPPAWDLYRELTWLDPFLDERAAQVKRKRESSGELSDEYGDDLPVRLAKSITSTAQPQTSQGYITATTPQTHHVQPASSQQSLQQYMIMPIAEQPTRYAAIATTSNHAGKAQSNVGAGQQSGLRPVAVLPNGTTVVVQTPNSSMNTNALAAPPNAANLQQQVIIANEPLDGDRAFAVSVTSDLSALPHDIRTMARAQILHLLENSKITIVKA